VAEERKHSLMGQIWENRIVASIVPEVPTSLYCIELNEICPERYNESDVATRVASPLKELSEGEGAQG